MFFNKYKRIWKEEVKKLRASMPSCAAAEKLDKYFDAWKASLEKGRGPMADAQPWISFAATDLIAAYLRKEMRVFEFGGGGSTLFFTQRVAEVITAEHDPEWFPAIEKGVRDHGLNNWKGIACPAEEGGDATASIADPDAYISDDASYKGKQFRSYASSIDAYADGYFDLVIVDGRARPSCLKHALPKVKSGGLLVLDNSDRAYYTEKTKGLIEPGFEELLSCKGPGPYLEWFTQTTVWKKK